MSAQPLLLHHYTSGSGLLGIFQSDSIWATQIHYLNDTKEFSHAISEARSALFARRLESNDTVENALSEALAEALDRVAAWDAYVACFSEIEDSLSQWRGYCPSGFGYSLGLHASELQRIVRPQGFELVQCIYDPEQQRRLVASWAAKSLAALRHTLQKDANPAEHVGHSGHLFFPEFVRFAPVLKDQAFRAEAEWRLVGMVASNDKVRLRAGRSMLLPYVPINLGLKLNQSLVWNIRIGPTPNMRLATSAVSYLMDYTRIENGIGPSQVPYREW